MKAGLPVSVKSDSHTDAHVRRALVADAVRRGSGGLEHAVVGHQRHDRVDVAAPERRGECREARVRRAPRGIASEAREQVGLRVARRTAYAVRRRRRSGRRPPCRRTTPPRRRRARGRACGHARSRRRGPSRGRGGRRRAGGRTRPSTPRRRTGARCRASGKGLLDDADRLDGGRRRGAAWVLAEEVAVEAGADVGDGAAAHQGSGPEVLADDVVDEVTHRPVAARGRQVPLVVRDPGRLLRPPPHAAPVGADRGRDRSAGSRWLSPRRPPITPAPPVCSRRRARVTASAVTRSAQEVRSGLLTWSATSPEASAVSAATALASRRCLTNS